MEDTQVTLTDELGAKHCAAGVRGQSWIFKTTARGGCYF